MSFDKFLEGLIYERVLEGGGHHTEGPKVLMLVRGTENREGPMHPRLCVWFAAGQRDTEGIERFVSKKNLVSNV